MGPLHCDLVLLREDADAKVNTAKTLIEADQAGMERPALTLPTGIVWLDKEHQWPGRKALSSGAVQRGCSPAVGSRELASLTAQPVENEDQRRTPMCQEPENLAALGPVALNAIEKEGSQGAMRKGPTATPIGSWSDPQMRSPAANAPRP